ncbi:MAG: hypothetical protein ACREMV_12870 [Gemmatimonadales bacterium]
MSPAHWRRLANRYIVSAATTIAAALAMGGVFVFLGNDTAIITVVAVAFVLVLLAVWYHDHPVFTNERRFLGLRAEVDRFITLVRDLNRAAISPKDPAEFTQVKEKMRRSLDRMAELAGKEGPPQPE